jgi:hypothetical protein
MTLVGVKVLDQGESPRCDRAPNAVANVVPAFTRDGIGTAVNKSCLRAKPRRP